MNDREQYEPGPARGAQVQKDGEKWTLILVRELRHSPEKVWQALTDPAHLREWARFETDGSLGTIGTIKLTWVGTPTTIETKVTRAEAPKVLEYDDIRWELEASGGPHAADAVAQNRSPFHLDGRGRVAHLARRSGSPPQWNSHRPHRWRGRDEVRRLAALERRVRQAVRY